MFAYSTFLCRNSILLQIYQDATDACQVLDEWLDGNEYFFGDKYAAIHALSYLSLSWLIEDPDYFLPPEGVCYGNSFLAIALASFRLGHLLQREHMIRSRN